MKDEPTPTMESDGGVGESSTPNCAPPSSPVYPHADHRLSRSRHHFTFSPRHPPALTVRPGELIRVETLDCFCGAFDHCDTASEADGVSPDRSKLNPVTGPIYVAGAEPGDTLSVTIHDIKPGRRGVARCGPDSGQLRELVDGECTRFFRVEGGAVTMQEEDCGNCGDGDVEGGRSGSRNGIGRRRSRVAPITFPSRPMLGIVGVAPRGNKPIGTMPAGRHGGNLDCSLNSIGTTLHLPVSHPGALLSVGDMHASQGDGEIIGTGIEVGGDVLLSCQILKGVQSGYPVSETDTVWATHGVTTEDIPGATTVACREAASLLMEQWGFSAVDASVFLGVRGDLGLCQAVHPDQGTQIARMVVPKLEACPRPFRCQQALGGEEEGDDHA